MTRSLHAGVARAARDLEAHLWLILIATLLTAGAASAALIVAAAFAALFVLDAALHLTHLARRPVRIPRLKEATT